MTMLSRIFAQRYLFSAQSRSVINLISGLSVVSVAVPVAAMIILLSVFNGFERLARSVCSATDADLTISLREGKTFLARDIDSAKLAAVQGVEHQAAVLEENILLEHDGHQATATLRGVAENYTDILPMEDYISAGHWQVELGDFDRVVVGQALAMQLGIRTLADTEIAAYAVKRNAFSSLMPLANYTRRRIALAGVYMLDLETEQTYVFTSLRFARELLHYPDRVSAVTLKIRGDAERVKRDVETVVGEKFLVETREERKASIYKIMEYEKWGIFFITLMVLTIASFSIVGALAMLIVDKRKDIATLRALGAGNSLIRSIFRAEGLLITAWGGAIGVGLGVGLCMVQQIWGIIEIPADSFLTKTYPVELALGDLGIVVISFAAVGFLLAHLTAHTMIKSKL